MICYKDMTFCNIWESCENAKRCHRAFTPKVQEAADKWWEGFKIEGGAPVCFGDFSKAECYKRKDKK